MNTTITTIGTQTDTLFARLGIAAPAGPVDLEARSKELIQEHRLKDFMSRCPAEFRSKIDPALLPNLAAWEGADRWTPGEFPGLWLWSDETGRGKTRMLWRKIGQAAVRLGLRHIYTTGAHLGEWQYESYRDGKPTEFHQRFRNQDVVFLDDLDKYPLTEERAARPFRELWDFFYTKHISVLVSANEPPEFIKDCVGQSAYRRVQEVCRAVRF